MLVQDINTLITDLQSTNRLPQAPLVAPAPAQDLTGRQFDYADLLVDLEKVMKLAYERGATAVNIFADTLTIPDRYIGSVAETVQSVSIIARRIITGGKAKLTLVHDDEHSKRFVRMMVHEIDPNFFIISKSGKDEFTYDLHTTQSTSRPCFNKFGLYEGKARVGQIEVPAGFLVLGEPLYKTLSASFSLAAGIIGINDETPRRLRLAHDILTWITQWSGLQSDLAQISQQAETLRGIVPLEIKGDITFSIPPRITASYLEVAASHVSLAKKIELDAKLADQEGTVADIAQQFVAANRERDLIETNLIAKEIKASLSRINSLEQAIERAATAVRKQKFHQEIAKIDLDLAIELDNIKKTVSATFEITFGIISLGASIAAICVGVPADPSAAGKKGINGVQGLIGAIKSGTGNSPLFSQNVNNILNLMSLYCMPVTFIWKNGKDHLESAKNIAKTGIAIATAGQTVMKGLAVQDNVDEIASVVGEAMRELATKPDAIEVKAAWDALETESVNNLDVIINDSNTASKIKQAAAAYKTSVQKIAIYGRQMAEQQATKDTVERELGALVLRRCAQVAKLKSLASVINNLTNRQSLNAALQALSSQHLEEVYRSFFATAYGFRRAQYYETYTYPIMVPVIANTAAEMSKLYAEMVTNHTQANSEITDKLYGFKTTLEITDKEILTQLANGDTANISLTPEQSHLASEFSRFSRIRLSAIEAWLELPSPTDEQIGIELISNSVFSDKYQSEEMRFAGEKVQVLFEYEGTQVKVNREFRGIQPTPFANWMVTLYRPANKISTPQALRLQLTGMGIAQ